MSWLNNEDGLRLRQIFLNSEGEVNERNCYSMVIVVHSYFIVIKHGIIYNFGNLIRL